MRKIQWGGDVEAAPVHPGRSVGTPESLVHVHVVFTSQKGALAAIREAARWSHQLAARVGLLMAVPVGYPAPLTSAWGRVDVAKRGGRRLAAIARVPMDIRVFLCRDAAIAFAQYLPPQSIVLIGGPRRWWGSREERLAKRLCAAGLNALFIPDREESHA